MPLQLDKEKAKNNLAEVFDRVSTSADPALLNEYRKIFKKEISFFRQSWVAAWLLMYYDQRENPHSGAVPAKSGREKRKDRRQEEQAPGVGALTEEESKQLFISIGRNRRLYPREVITLIISKTSAGKEDIGSVKILDNYSFVQVRDAKAEEIKEKLNGVQFRGRTLTVNYARSAIQS